MQIVVIKKRGSQNTSKNVNDELAKSFIRYAGKTGSNTFNFIRQIVAGDGRGACRFLCSIAL
jgi:hypothetical protein